MQQQNLIEYIIHTTVLTKQATYPDDRYSGSTSSLHHHQWSHAVSSLIPLANG